MGRCRRLAKDVERTVPSSLAWVKLAGCRFMMRRVARHQRTTHVFGNRRPMTLGTDSKIIRHTTPRLTAPRAHEFQHGAP